MAIRALVPDEEQYQSMFNEVADRMYALFGEAWSVGFTEEQILTMWREATQQQESAAEDHERRKRDRRESRRQR